MLPGKKSFRGLPQSTRSKPMRAIEPLSGGGRPLGSSAIEELQARLNKHREQERIARAQADSEIKTRAQLIESSGALALARRKKQGEVLTKPEEVILAKALIAKQEIERIETAKKELDSRRQKLKTALSDVRNSSAAEAERLRKRNEELLRQMDASLAQHPTWGYGWWDSELKDRIKAAREREQERDRKGEKNPWRRKQ